MFIPKIICGDSTEKVLELRNDSIDLVITSPPYNVDLGSSTKVPYRGEYDNYDDNQDYEAYMKGLSAFFRNLYPKLKDNARVCINIGDTLNGKIPNHVDVTNFMTKHLGYDMYTSIVWNKNTTGNRAAWGSFVSPSAPSFPTPYEFILIFSKGNQPKDVDWQPFLNQDYEFWSELSDKPVTWKQVSKMTARGPNKAAVKRAKAFMKNAQNEYKQDKITMTKEEFIEYTWSIWKFAPQNNQRKHGHPAMFPVELPRRLIKMLSYKGDTVLDPYMGIGTTGLACKEQGRKFIGIDISENYCNIAEQRIKEY